jgi:hypothetical protein
MSKQSNTTTTNNELRPLSKSRFFRIYQEDYDSMLEWEKKLNASTGLTVVKMLRDAVAAGWPAVEEKLKAATKGT